MAQTIKPYETYTGVPDVEIVAIGTKVQMMMFGNANFSNSPVDLAVLQTDIDTLSALIAEAQDGSKKVIAQKNKQRAVVVTKLRLLGRYVEVTCKDDMAMFQTSGFVPVPQNRSQRPHLSQNIRSIGHGSNSGEIVVRLLAVPQASSYELRYAAAGNGGGVPVWTTDGVANARSAVTLKGLTPGTTYSFQVRSLGKSGYSDWSDSVTFICT